MSIKPFALLLLLLPFYAWHVWKRRESLGVIWMSWALAIALPFMMIMLTREAATVFGWTAYGLLGVVYYLAGHRWFGESRGFKNPLRTLGSLGIAIVAVAFTYRDIHADWDRRIMLPPVALGCFLIIAVLAWLALGTDLLKRKMEFNRAAALLPVLFPFGIWLPKVGALFLLINVAVLALGVFTLLRGVRRDSLFSMNEGAVLIAALVVCRYFNDDYGFVARGVAFIMIGCGFLVMNWIVMNRRRKQAGVEMKGGVS